MDLHEQGGNNSYYFAPPADPLNPHYTKQQLAGFDLFGRANAARFDERGWAYYIREVYDGFYPGYGDSWPMMHGSIGMTYEQASARALSFARTDGTVMTFRDGVMHHFNAAITTAITAARNRQRLVRDFLEFRRSAVAEGESGPVREYVLVPGHDPSRADALARNLATQGIEVRRTEEPVTVGARTIPAGAYVVAHAQPAGRLVRNLLDLDTKQADAFIARQEARRQRRQPDQIYDITGWSLPLVYDVEVVTSPTAIAVKAAPVPASYVRGARSAPGGGRQGGLPGAVGVGRGRAHRRRRGPGTARPQRRRRLHARRAHAIRSARPWSAPPVIQPTCRPACRRWPPRTAPRSCRSTRPTSNRARRSAATRAASSSGRAC